MIIAYSYDIILGKFECQFSYDLQKIQKNPKGDPCKKYKLAPVFPIMFIMIYFGRALCITAFMYENMNT